VQRYSSPVQGNSARLLQHIPFLVSIPVWTNEVNLYYFEGRLCVWKRGLLFEVRRGLFSELHADFLHFIWIHVSELMQFLTEDQKQHVNVCELCQIASPSVRETQYPCE
jgi:hypothetical protein